MRLRLSDGGASEFPKAVLGLRTAGYTLGRSQPTTHRWIIHTLAEVSQMLRALCRGLSFVRRDGYKPPTSFKSVTPTCLGIYL